uniref:Acyl carrier protein n=1 Tax=Eunotia naegelii TaxID=1458866 RepID=A0A023JEG7_9STRA|nr:acyl carrier protein [Eunotia naegelii]YP_009059326.1 acyl carrier protein [Eunotia naegelii]AHI51195.1 acyl carrier protein [Eunotia naegelii]AHI51273.1 acyl carrier protein [Eunotia naegelii]
MNKIFNEIRTILHEKFSFHYDQIEPETKFELELGTDSLEMLELLTEFEQAFDIEISQDDIDKIIKEGKVLTIQDVIDYIKEKKVFKIN